MKIDQEYIDSIIEEQDNGNITKQEAKVMLADYAKESFNFDVKRTKTFENMVKDIKEYVESYVEEEIEDTDGLSITDLIEAADQKDGKSVFNEAKPEALELVSDLVHRGATPETVTLPFNDEEAKIVPLKTPVEPVIEHKQKVDETIKVKEGTKPEAIKGPYKLPEDFVPTILLIGRAPGFYTLPWWIYKWILENEDWKDRPEDCPEYSAINVLKSLIYFINRDGQVRIRETRNSQFYTLS